MASAAYPESTEGLGRAGQARGERCGNETGGF